MKILNSLETIGFARRQLSQTGVLVLLLILVFLGWGVTSCLQHSPRAQLERLNAARAIPDEKNAAIAYAQMFCGDAAPDLAITPSTPVLRRWRSLLSEYERLGQLKRKAALPKDLPWRHESFPAVAQWLDDHGPQLEALGKSAVGDHCVIPVHLPRRDGGCTWLDLVVAHCDGAAHAVETAAYLDMGEGRLAAAEGRALTLIRIGHHLQQQPTVHSYVRGAEIEQSAIRLLSALRLQDLDSERSSTAETGFQLEGPRPMPWKELGQGIEPIETLFLKYREEQCWRRDRWRNLRNGKTLALLETRQVRPYHALADPYLIGTYQGLVSARIRYQVFRELVRYRGRTGSWPTRLEQIEGRLDAGTLVQLAGEVPFVHRISPDAFVLYSHAPERPGRAGVKGLEVIVVTGADAVTCLTQRPNDA